MPRPRKVSDDDVYAAAFRVMQRVAPAEFTLDAIAREAGLTAGALVQRFGSKKQLQVDLARAAARSGPAMVEALRRRHRSPLAALRAYGDCMAELGATPADFVRSLAYLQEDLADPDLRALLEEQGSATRCVLERIIGEAVAEGQLIPATQPKCLARTMEAIVTGALLTWAFYRRTSAKTWVGREVDAVLAPWIASRR